MEHIDKAVDYVIYLDSFALSRYDIARGSRRQRIAVFVYIVRLSA